MKHRPVVRALPLLILAFYLGGCARPRQLTILHVNDMHTHYLPEVADWSREEPKPLTGGMVALQSAVAREKAASAATLVLDAGDWLTGTPLSDMDIDGVKGGGFIAMMNAIGFDASTIGNHDFDNGVATLPGLIAMANFPVLSANLYKDGTLLAPAPWVVLERGGLKVGVVGLILEDLGQEISSEMMMGIQVKPVATAAREAIAVLDPQTDLIVLLTHQGWREDSLLATRIDGADVIVGGHSHSRLKTPRVVNGVIVAQAGSYVRDLGRLDLTVEEDRVIAHEGRLISLLERDITHPDSGLSTLTRGFEERIAAEFEVVIGQAPVALDRNYFAESPLGDRMSDILRELTGADMALINSGGLRSDLDAGPITRMDVKEIMPFQNTIVIFSCTGEQVLTLLQTNAEASLSETQGILQMSGLACSFRRGESGVEIHDARAGGLPVNPTRMYTVATVDYVLGLADKYMGFTPKAHESRGGTLFQSVCDWIAAHPYLDAPQGGRFVRLP